MAHKTIWKCDRCGTVWDSDEYGYPGPLTGIAIISNGGEYCSGKEEWKAAWCDDCLIATGVTRPKSKPAAPPPTEPPTLEDMVRQIVRETI